jgi:hypothetical protein
MVFNGRFSIDLKGTSILPNHTGNVPSGNLT